MTTPPSMEFPDPSVALGYASGRAVAEAASAGWDGHGAVAPSRGAVSYAWALVRSLSRLASDADIQIDPQGEVLLEWAASPRWILTVAINEAGRIAYSAMFGSARIRGVENFDGSVPVALSHAIARIRDHKATLASAGRSPGNAV